MTALASAPDLRYIVGMTTLFFFQIVGAVFLGCALFFACVHSFMTIHKKEKEGGSIRDVSGWTLFLGVLGPFGTAFVIYLLK